MDRRDFLSALQKKIKACIADNEAKYNDPACIGVQTHNSHFEVERLEKNRHFIGSFIIAWGVVVEKEINEIDKELYKL